MLLTAIESGGYTIKCLSVNPKLSPFLFKYKLLGPLLPLVDETNKANLEAQQRLHKLRAKTLYALLQEERDDLVTFSFDCQKNLVLPKFPDQSAYFIMQINFYHLAIVCGSSRIALNSSNVRSFVWTELDFQRSSNQTAFALHFTVRNFDFRDDVLTVRLCCDGCGAQNKNSVVVSTLNYWLQFEAPSQIKKIELVFLVVGHSYIPPDRLPGTRGNPLVRGETLYKTDFCTPKSLSRNVSQIQPRPLDLGVPLNNDKKQSIKKLLEYHYGEDVEKQDSLANFKDVFKNGVDNLCARGRKAV
nr:unnamed protein product [Callosobruchus analis]